MLMLMLMLIAMLRMIKILTIEPFPQQVCLMLIPMLTLMLMVTVMISVMVLVMMTANVLVDDMVANCDGKYTKNG